MRIFIALTMPKTVISRLSKTCAALRPKIKSGVRWVPPENMHLTLRFLGEVSDIQVALLKDRLQCISTLPSFELNFTQYGAYPAWKAPNSIWIGFEKTQDLNNLQMTIESIVRDCGHRPGNKAFRPHLTLARVKRNPSNTITNQLRETFEGTLPPRINSFDACHVVLFQSILKQKGAFYQALHTVELQR